MMIYSKVAACTSQPVAFSGYPSTHRHLTGFVHKQTSAKADLKFGQTLHMRNSDGIYYTFLLIYNTLKMCTYSRKAIYTCVDVKCYLTYVHIQYIAMYILTDRDS